LVAAVGQGHWRRSPRPRPAIAIKAVTTPTTSVAIVNVSADGSIALYCGTIDMGQGSNTVMAQIVGEVLNVPAESVRFAHATPMLRPTIWVRLARGRPFDMGHAVRIAAEDARKNQAACTRGW
jgi:CO/xanthine dehydrogenase Mo-binding subunit